MMVMIEDRKEDRPPSGKDAALSALLGYLAVSGFGGVAFGAWILLFDRDVVWGSPEAWWSIGMLAVMLLIGGVAVLGLKRLKPRLRSDGPISPATRKTNRLYALSGLVAVPGMLALVFGTMSEDDPSGLASNSPISPTIAIVAITSWLLAMGLSWWWHFSSDEHERQAYAFGALAAGGLFVTLTPAWWLAARGGFLPEPDGMILWCSVMAVWIIGWFWQRYR